jgi:hypothetical protein
MFIMIMYLSNVTPCDLKKSARDFEQLYNHL